MLANRATIPTIFLLLWGATVGAVQVRAQAVPGEQPAGPGGWAPPSLGVHFGWDQKQRDEILGAQVRLPVLPSGELELMGSMDVTFLTNLKEYQYNVEVLYVLDGRAGGFYGGGGLGMRDTIYPDQTQRSTEMGYTAVVGFRLVGLGLIVPQLEYRWTFINEAPFTYQNLSLGASVAFWRHVSGP